MIQLTVKDPGAKFGLATPLLALNSRANLTVRLEQKIGGLTLFSMFPEGASKGDGEKKSIGAKEALKEMQVFARQVENFPLSKSQNEFDYLLRSLSCEASTTFSILFAQKQAIAYYGTDLWRVFNAGQDKAGLPVRMLNLLNAGKHADTGFEVQESGIMPVGAKSMGDAIMMGANVLHTAKKLLMRENLGANRGDEGGFANPFKSVDATCVFLLDAIALAGYQPGKDIFLFFDPASSEYYGKGVHDKAKDQEDFTYHLEDKRLTSLENALFWKAKVEKYPIASLEDGHAQHDREGWQKATKLIGGMVQIVGDDRFVSDPGRVRKGIDGNEANSVLIKVNQIGDISQSIESMDAAHEAGWTSVVSHRSGETEDIAIADLSTHPKAGQLKCGPSGSDRTGKDNRLWGIEQQHPEETYYRGFGALSPGVARSLQERFRYFHWEPTRTLP